MPAGSNKGGGGARFAGRAGHRDVAPEADDVVEFQLLGQHPAELLITEPTIGNDAHLDVRREGIGQADKRLIFIFVAPVLEGGFIDRQPQKRCRSPVLGQQREHNGGLAIGIKIGPIHGHIDAGARSHHIGISSGSARHRHRFPRWTVAGPLA